MVGGGVVDKLKFIENYHLTLPFAGNDRHSSGRPTDRVPGGIWQTVPLSVDQQRQPVLSVSDAGTWPVQFALCVCVFLIRKVLQIL